MISVNRRKYSDEIVGKLSKIVAIHDQLREEYLSIVAVYPDITRCQLLSGGTDVLTRRVFVETLVDQYSVHATDPVAHYKNELAMRLVWMAKVHRVIKKHTTPLGEWIPCHHTRFIDMKIYLDNLLGY